MKLLLSIFTAAALCTAYGQGTIEAIQGYNNPVAAFWNGTAGGTFTVGTNITVTALGAFDYLFALNPGTIQVGLWDSTGHLVASNTISSTDQLVNQTRYDSITPVTLQPNQLYSMGAYSTNGTIFLDIAGPATGGAVTNAPQLTLGNSAAFQGGFSAPVIVSNTLGTIYLGANFEILSGVPEPTVGLLAGMAGLLIAAGRKWYSRSRK
jgi:hypothetical protein